MPQDAETLYRLSLEEPYAAWLPSQVYQDQADAESALAFLIRHYSLSGDPRRGPYVLGIEHRLDRVLVGHLGLSPLDDEVEIGFSIGSDYQERGLATEAIVAAASWAFQVFGLPRIIGVTDAVNLASQRTLLRAGFLREGDRVMNFQGVEKEVHVYGLVLKAEIPG